DLDRFKEINDTQGHDVGDQVLREVARRFQQIMRASDTLARLGGDEFGIVASNIDQAEAILIAKRLSSCLEARITVDGESFTVGVSVGVSYFPDDGATPDLLLRNADIAMYRAKASRQGLAAYNNAMSAGLAERLALARDLQEALVGAQRQLALHYQPQIDLKTGVLVGAEALLRWRHPTLGAIGTDVFLPLAEERGMMAAIGAWVLQEACRQMAEWREAGLSLPGRMAVNIAAQELEDIEFRARLVERVTRFGISAEQIEFELTESGVMRNVDRAVDLFGQLNGIGFSLAVDDFGTGYSSLAYLKRLPVKKLKIDRTFVRDMAEDANDHAIVATIIAMGRTLGLRTTAEGVETKTQAQALLALGCEHAQGYLFGAPEPPEDFATRWLKQKQESKGECGGVPSAQGTIEAGVGTKVA
ncbi:MAG TPA: bifunctional diguanylate cyclase/phosphodiesterase, partial [Burkholderiaceae bacterium]|nr:bifunctional diguanylate cyclase/phosphodiesterase [Burkholderiaceae bacterium]